VKPVVAVMVIMVWEAGRDQALVALEAADLPAKHVARLKRLEMAGVDEVGKLALIQTGKHDAGAFQSLSLTAFDTFHQIPELAAIDFGNITALQPAAFQHIGQSVPFDEIRIF